MKAMHTYTTRMKPLKNAKNICTNLLLDAYIPLVWKGKLLY